MRIVRYFVFWQILALAWWSAVWMIQWLLPLSLKEVTMHWHYYFSGATLAFFIRYIPMPLHLQRNIIIAIGAVTALWEVTDRSRFFWYVAFQAHPAFSLMWMALGGIAHFALYLSASRLGLVTRGPNVPSRDA